MEDGETERFLPLPIPQQPMVTNMGTLLLPHGMNWMPAPPPHPIASRRGGFSSYVPPRHPLMILQSLEELDQHLEVANTPSNELAVA